MSNPIISVFNHLGNFSGNVTLNVNNIGIAELTKLLVPHVVTESVNANSKIFTVKPMHGLQLSEQDFYNLVRATLSASKIVAADDKFSTGYDNMMVESTANIVDDVVTVSTVISQHDVGLISIVIDVPVSQVANKLEAIRTARHANMTRITGINKLLVLAGEWANERLTDLEKQAIDDFEVKEPPVLQRPQVNSEDFLDKERRRNREIIDTMVKENLPKPDEYIKAYMDVKSPEREEPVRVVIELLNSEYQRLQDEGIVVTLISEFEGAICANSMLMVNSTQGYLFKIRKAIDNHGVKAKSITPRSITGTNEDELINLI